MPDYSNGKIYAIRAPGTDMVYIGSTTQPLSKRFATHRAYYRAQIREYTSSDLFAIDGCYIELIESYPCDNKEQLNKREGEVIRSFPNAVNRQVAGRTLSEYYQENKEDILQKSKRRYENNKEVVKARVKAYREANREIIKIKDRERRQKRKES